MGASVFALAACRARPATTDLSLQGLLRVRDSHTLRAAYINYPPSLIVNPNSKAIGGIMADVLSQAAQAIGVKLSYVEETSFGSMVDSLENNHADIVVSGIWPSSARALRADFSRAVYFSPIYAYVRTENKDFDGNLSSINQPKVRIATIDGELSSIIAQSDYPNAQVASLPQQTDVSQLLLQLTSRKADVTFVEPAIADAFIAKNQGSIRTVANAGPVRMFPNCFLFRKGDTGLRDAIDVALLELTNSQRLPGIIKTYDHGGNHFILPTLPVSP
jgi:ABC-type amino acid transport substrate-binding protein